MVGFKEWRDYNLFMQNYAKCCCQNCTGWIDSAMDDGRFVCMRTVSPVRLDMISVCVEWQNKNGKTLDDYDRSFPLWISENVWEKLIEIEEDLTFEEIREIIDDEKHKEQKSH